MRLTPLASLVGTLFLASTALHAASFDCKKATTHMEQTICSNSDLSELDSQLAGLYRMRLAESKSSGRAEELRVSQRNWHQGVRLHCKSLSCFVTSYKVRLKELSQFERLGIEGPTHLGVDEAALLSLLNDQLVSLKKLLNGASTLKIQNFLDGKKLELCQLTADRINQASVPAPFQYANTTETKYELFQKLKKIAQEKRAEYLATINSAKEGNEFDEKFKHTWDRVDLGEFGNANKSSSHMLLMSPSTPLANRKIFFSRVLPDQKSDGLTIDLGVLAKNGLPEQSHWALFSESDEAFGLYDHEAPFSLPHDRAGLLTINDDISYWRLTKRTQKTIGDYWELVVAPVFDIRSDQFVACGFRFY